ncbi:MAG: penicillin-binding protein activator, partial [Candidatus Neomarinimicrobiota bacterium]|nr:penicillin-binding protein activator [Candidatus Neomarinimicrobiota bacterium]
ALHGINDIDQSLFVAKQINDDKLDPNLKTIYNIELGDIFSEISLFDKAFEHYLSANKSNTDPRAKKRINQRLNKLLRMGLDQNTLSSIALLEDNSNNLNIIKLAQSFTLASDKSQKWKEIFSSVDYSMLSREFRSSYNYLKKNLSTSNYFIAKVGIVLSLTGDNSEYAQAFLSGLQKGNELLNNKNKISYIIYDNQGNQLNTIKAFNELHSFHKVDAIIGPTNSKNLISGATALSNSGIPIFAPGSIDEDIHSINSNVHLLNSSIDYKNEVLANHMISNLGLEQIAIIAPKTDDGIKEVDSFLEQMNKLNKEPVSVQWYENTDPVDLRPLFTELREVAWEIKSADEYKEFLGVDIDTLDAMFDVDSDDVYDMFDFNTQEEEIDSTKVVLDIIDGVFLPLSGQGLTYVGTQIALANLETQFFGNELWLDLDFINQENVSSHIIGMYFVSSFLPNYRVGNKFDYNAELNNAFHYGLDLSRFLNSTIDGNNFNMSSSNSNKYSSTRRFDFSGGQVNRDINLFKYSNRRLIKTKIVNNQTNSDVD